MTNEDLTNEHVRNDALSGPTWAPPQAVAFEQHAPVGRTRRKGLAVGLSAGLLGGAAAGLMFAMPGSTSAATDESTGDVIAAIAQVDSEDPADDTNTPASDDATDDVDRLTDRTERIRGNLDEMVTDGVITAEQADAVAAHLAQSAPDRGGVHGRRGHHANFGTVTELLGIDGETLRTELQGGSTLAEVAEANGVSTDELVDALVADAMEHLDAAVENGRLDQAEADERAADLEERITERVTTARPQN